MTSCEPVSFSRRILLQGVSKYLYRQYNLYFMYFQQIVLLTQHVLTERDHLQAFIIINDENMYLFMYLLNEISFFTFDIAHIKVCRLISHSVKNLT